MCAYLEAMGDDTHPLTEDIENIRQLSSLMMKVNIGGDTLVHTRSDESSNPYLLVQDAGKMGMQ